VATSFNNLAGLYRSQGQYDQAEPLYTEAVTILISQLGLDHPNTQTVLQNYWIFLQQVQIENRQDSLSNEMSLQIISQMEAQGIRGEGYDAPDARA